MSYLVLALGLALALCGAAAMWFGYGIVNVERGWASVIGGAAALSGGVVTIALAAVLHSLSRLRAAVQRGASAEAGASMNYKEERGPPLGRLEASPPPPAAALPGGPVSTLPDQDIDAPAAAVEPDAPAAAAQASIEQIRRAFAETIKRAKPEPAAPAPTTLAAAPAPPPAAAAAPAPPLRRPGQAPFGLPRAVDLAEIAPQHFGKSRESRVAPAEVVRASQDNPEFPGRQERSRPVAGGQPADAAPRPPPAAQTAARGDARFDVVGRYESDGTSYVMYADGSIDARSALGAFHFSSMAELKAFMDAQAGGSS